jgi:hypothetical protein
MAVLRQANLLGNQRVDIPHLRALESAVAGDIDLLAGVMIAGKAPLITAGFYVLSTGITIATGLKIRVADSSLIHFLASESGSIFHVPSDRPDEQLNSVNPRIIGGFTAGMVNYIGLDFVREADDSTVDLVEFIDSDSELETPVQVPLGRTLDYRIVITTLDFDNNPGICPVAKVTLDDTNNITLLEDARHFAFRLGTGGTLPNIKNSYAWPAGRAENLTGDTFVGADKAISNFKDWMDAIMSRMWEVGGGEYWYSPTNPINERLARTGSPFVSNGEYFEWDGTNIHWKGLVWIFANSTGVVNPVQDQTSDSPGLTDLVDGECIYVDVDRTQDTTIIAAKAALATLGSPEIPGSRYVIAWRHGNDIYTRDQSYAVNSAFKNATTAAGGMVKLSATNGTSSFPAQVATVDDINYFAYAGGLSRSGDFFGGAGDIQIGGRSSSDHNNLLITTEDQYETRVEAENNFLINGVSALTIVQHKAFTSEPRHLMLRLRAYNGDADRLEDAMLFETGGSQQWKLYPTAFPSAPVNTTTSPMVGKEFHRTNQLSTPNTRNQHCMQWQDGTVTVLAEGPAY